MSDDGKHEFRNTNGNSIESIDEPSRRSILRAAGLFASTGLVGSVLTTTSGTAAAGKPANDATSQPPGPDVLYKPPVRAPQFENAGEWEADPLLVSGADAYIEGEYLSQDWIYDDYGANTTNANVPPEPLAATSCCTA